MIDYIPLGSVVLLRGGTQKVLIIGRGINVKKNNKIFFYDYVGVPYPEGLIGDKVAYFNHDSLSRIFFRGCQDMEDEVMVENINRYLEKTPNVIRGDAKSLLDK